MAEVTSSRLASEVRGMNLKEEGSDAEDMDTIPVALPADGDRSPALAPAVDSSTPRGIKRPSRSPTKMQSATQSPMPKTEEEDHIGGGVSLKLEPGKQPKLSRSVSQKVEKRAPQMFLEYENKTSEATSSFQ
ncbi:histone methyltransferase set2, partial [Oleoguttula sp. CCFEE 5521]